MKCYVRIMLAWVLFSMPSMLFSSQPYVVSGANDDVVRHRSITMPDRDEADDDSVVYEYGFELGWSGWTRRDLTEVAVRWHTTDFHAFEDGSSWWCGDEELGGYDNHWLQYLMTPVLDLSGRENLRLLFKLYYNCEDPDGEGMDPPSDTSGYDGWDGCNVWISTNGGDDWEIVRPAVHDYDYESLYSFGEEWGMGFDIPGWAGFETEWFDVEFDLSDYATEDVRIRWAFCSDPAWATGNAPDDDREAIGMLVDEMQILAGDDVVWENDGSDAGDMETEAAGETAGEFWEISGDDIHGGEFAAHCPIRANLMDALISPPLVIPEAGWYTYFEFWVHTHSLMPNPDGDRGLDDYFALDYSLDGLLWQSLLWDYARDNSWMINWMHYVPGLWYAPGGEAEWRVNLNLTQFAGDTLFLRWVVKTDDNMDDDQGTGFWIDDFQLFTTSQAENDVGIEWMFIDYPAAINLTTNGTILVKNNGLASQNNVRKYFNIDDARGTPVTPWQEDLPPDTSREYNFRMRNLTYSGVVSVTAWTDLAEDARPLNNSATKDVLIYPAGMAQLGYDMREWTDVIRYPENNGPAVQFTPDDDGIDGSFDLNAVMVRWDETEQDGDVTTTLRIFDEINNRLGDELYSEEITITPQNLHPNVHYIDLSGVDELKDMAEPFWVYFHVNHYNADNDDYLPQVKGRFIGERDPYWGEGHYFNSNGQDIVVWDCDLQIQAVIAASGVVEDGANLIAGREEIDFGEVWFPKTVRLTVFGGGAVPVSINDVSVDNDAFNVQAPDDYPIVLSAGKHAVFLVNFDPDGLGDYSGTLTFDTNDEAPPEVHLNGILDVGNDSRLQPVKFILGEAYPNPFNAMTVIPFSLPYRADVYLAIYNLAGRKITDLVSGSVSMGSHAVTFNAENLPTGLYLYRLSAGDFSAVRKMVLVK